MQLKRPLRQISRVLFQGAPIDAQLVVTRRCNLSCGYCSEYDNSSEPVPTEELKARIDALLRLKAANITFLGGEPLLHPEIVELVAYAGREANTSIVTNGFLLRPSVIDALNEAGLNNLTVSVDTLHADPTRYIQKSLRSLRNKLVRLKALARFDVHVTAVLCEASRDHFEQFVDEIEELGLRMSVNLVHDGKGHIAIRGERYAELYDYFHSRAKSFTSLDADYNRRLLRGENPSWKCRAGARYLYVDEFGKVQLCASQMGRLGKPVDEYTVDDLREQSQSYKGCEEGCSVGCAFRASLLDNQPLRFVSSVVKGHLNGTMRNNGIAADRRRVDEPEAAGT